MRNFRWKYIWPYCVFCATIIIAVAANVHLIRKGIGKNHDYALVINQAGRQRYLSQKNITDYIVCRKAGLSSNCLPPNLEAWNQKHALLGNRYGKDGTESSRSPATQKLRSLDGVQRKLYDLLKAEVAAGPDDTTVKELLRLQNEYLPGMDNVVAGYQKEAEEQLLQIRDQQVLVAALSGLALILEILILIIPYHRKLILAYRSLKANKHLIEEQSEEIQQQMHELSQNHELLEKRHRWEALTLEGINAGVWDWDIQSGNESWSPNFFRVLGYEVGEIPATFDTFLNFLLHPDDKDMVQKAVEAHLQRGEKYHVNIRMRTKDGTYKWFNASGQAAKDATGVPIQMAGSIIDINDKVLYEMQLESSNIAKNKIFAILSHDLRSPLSGIKSVLELQAAGVLTAEDFSRYVQKMNDGVRFALRTLDDILVWASTQMNIIKVAPRNVYLSDVFEEVEQFHRYSARQKELTIFFNAPPGLCAYADPNHVYIILRNLVGNAIKFTPNGGMVTVSATEVNDTIAVSVEDNGVGMSAELLQQLLVSREHVSEFGTNGEKGTGLGITLVLELLQLNGGRLTAESEPGKGSKFTATLPVDKSSFPDATPGPSAGNSSTLTC